MKNSLVKCKEASREPLPDLTYIYIYIYIYQARYAHPDEARSEPNGAVKEKQL